MYHISVYRISVPHQCVLHQCVPQDMIVQMVPQADLCMQTGSTGACEAAACVRLCIPRHLIPRDSECASESFSQCHPPSMFFVPPLSFPCHFTVFVSLVDLESYANRSMTCCKLMQMVFVRLTPDCTVNTPWEIKRTPICVSHARFTLHNVRTRLHPHTREQPWSCVDIWWQLTPLDGWR